MKRVIFSLLASAVVLSACQMPGGDELAVSVASLDTDHVVNIHESVEDDGDIAKLAAAMADLGIDHTVLHGIPNDLLHYEGQEVISYEGLDENHGFILDMVEENPELFSFFCAIDPSDLNRLGEVEECLENGGLGVKVYTGYSYAHDRSLDDAKLLKVYDLLEERGGILMLPVNTGEYQEELESVLAAYPNMTVICPHYCLSSKNLGRVSGLLDQYPNLYVDTSFGHIEFATEGFITMSENNVEFRTFFDTYQDRILFGTDTVITGYEYKNRDWLGQLYHDYVSILTAEQFESHVAPTLQLTGLGLSPAVQKKVFWQNWNDLVN